MGDNVNILLISRATRSTSIRRFTVGELVRVGPGVCFTIISAARGLRCSLCTRDDCSLRVASFPSRCRFLTILPHVRVRGVLNCCCHLHARGCYFRNRQRSFFRLACISANRLRARISNALCRLGRGSLVVCNPNRFRARCASRRRETSCVAVLFSVHGLAPIRQRI